MRSYNPMYEENMMMVRIFTHYFNPLIAPLANDEATKNEYERLRYSFLSRSPFLLGYVPMQETSAKVGA